MRRTSAGIPPRELVSRLRKLARREEKRRNDMSAAAYQAGVQPGNLPFYKSEKESLRLWRSARRVERRRVKTAAAAYRNGLLSFNNKKNDSRRLRRIARRTDRLRAEKAVDAYRERRSTWT